MKRSKNQGLSWASKIGATSKEHADKIYESYKKFKHETEGTMTTDKPAGEWEEYTILVKKDPSWPYHGTDIEFNGVRYVRADKPDAADEWNEFREHLNTVCSKEELQKMINGCEIVIRRVFYSGDHAEIMKELNIRYALISKRMEELILQREAGV